MPLNAVELKKLMKESSVMDALSDTSKEFKERLSYIPPICSIFNKTFITIEAMKEYKFDIDVNSKKKLYNIINNNVQLLIEAKNIPTSKKHYFAQRKKIGIVFSGGPSPGGHNVIAGLYDALKKANNKSSLFGFIMGPEGIIEGNYIELTRDIVDRHRNTGGFAMIKTGREKIDSPRLINLSKKTCKDLNLNAIVIVGGDDSNTNAAFLAQEMFNDKINVIGVPKTIDGDIQVKDINGKTLCATSFGFHTAAKSFSHFISNLCVDAESDIKYWHICKVMGRVASHLALEVGLQTHANLTLIGEEIADYVDQHRLKKITANNSIDYTAYGMTLNRLVRLICKSIIKRAEVGKNFGIIIIPEGILEFINEIQVIIIKLNSIIANYNSINNNDFHITFKSLKKKLEYLKSLISLKNKNSYPIWNIVDNNLFESMPLLLQKGLLTARDSHGNFQFSQVQTEKILIDLVKEKLKTLHKQGKYLIGIDKKYYERGMKKEGLNEKLYGPILFRNWNENKHLLFKYEITSKEKLEQVLTEAKLIDNKTPEFINKIFEKSIPDFKPQTHFYGYDGRGNNPTDFDCTYAYNLGQTVFHLINNKITGQMAGILNLDDDFSQWQPIGIPIPPLMHLEERKGKLSLVLEKSVVDLKSSAFQVFKSLRKKWLGLNQDTEHYKVTDPIQLTGTNNDTKPITLLINNIAKKIKQL